ncbi:glycine betaine/L-proline ABC transporter ATP-binding protein [Aurantimonas sp. VKM B-3413]|uniref:quaternary amine ABC transporter ATP-binding protein n=1 Tax=Aurantimonas sp. VKM B-3413 TaxID=2779401 RepID=UPI001E40451C|nr:glycine betaine/L-proline ABC transporter ATP-binding protein [Aurantimonas sp. VKM B-3413]MCB8838836.1 glycine betaine/L-proline ABC transporter ATP-binding protein [Aurantimonas sp. VKM B-3413]
MKSRFHGSMEAKLSIRNLYKIFGDSPDEALRLLNAGRTKEEILAETGNTVGVQDVNFDIEPGKIFVVMGLSGSGKSTLIRMLNGLIPPTSGDILIDGANVAKASDEEIRSIRREKIAMVFQHFALFPHKSVIDNVAFGLKIKGVGASERHERSMRALEQVGLGAYADSYPEQLSGGMQQRVGLARGLAAEPEVLLMDEPFGALDPLIRRDMQDELVQLQKTLNKTIVFITHDLNEALILGDKIAIMKGGRFVQVGTAEDIVGNPADGYVAAFTKDIDRSRVFKARRVARPANPVERASLTRSSALSAMDAAGRDAVYVVEDGKPVGILTYRDLAGLEPSADVSGAMIANFPSTRETTPISDLYPLAKSGLPIAVLSEDGRLAGVVESKAIFAELGRGPNEDEVEDTPVAAE